MSTARPVFKKKHSSVGENIVVREAGWKFGGNVPKTFSQHVRRSVPFYEEGHDLVCKISDFLVRDNSICYELGVSTGVLIKKLAQRHVQRRRVQWIGIDREKDMIVQAKKEVKAPSVKLLADNIVTFPYKKSDMIVAYYTMQFVPPHVRQELFNKIYKSLNWGGGFILFEKVRAPDARFQDMMQTLYADFKLDQNFSAEEIIAKTKSLKGVLEPFSTQGNLDLLKRAGFVDVMTVFKYICFEGFLAIK
jgi:tRNA (cmo5U34)-methyltransferase